MRASHASTRAASKAVHAYAWLPPHPSSYSPEHAGAGMAAPYYGSYPFAWGNSPGDAGAAPPQGGPPAGYIPRISTHVHYVPMMQRTIAYRPVYHDDDQWTMGPGAGSAAPQWPQTAPGARPIPPSAVHPGAGRQYYAGAGVYQQPDGTRWAGAYYNHHLRLPSRDYPHEEAMQPGPVHPTFHTSLLADELYKQISGGSGSGSGSA